MQDGARESWLPPQERNSHAHGAYCDGQRSTEREATESKRKCRRRVLCVDVSTLGGTEGLDIRTYLLIKFETCGSHGVMLTQRGLSLTSWFQALGDVDRRLFSFSSWTLMSTDLVPDLRAPGSTDRSRR